MGCRASIALSALSLPSSSASKEAEGSNCFYQLICPTVQRHRQYIKILPPPTTSGRLAPPPNGMFVASPHLHYGIASSICTEMPHCELSPYRSSLTVSVESQFPRDTIDPRRRVRSDGQTGDTSRLYFRPSRIADCMRGYAKCTGGIETSLHFGKPVAAQTYHLLPRRLPQPRDGGVIHDGTPATAAVALASRGVAQTDAPQSGVDALRCDLARTHAQIGPYHDDHLVLPRWVHCCAGCVVIGSSVLPEISVARIDVAQYPLHPFLRRR